MVTSESWFDELKPIIISFAVVFILYVIGELGYSLLYFETRQLSYRFKWLCKQTKDREGEQIVVSKPKLCLRMFPHVLAWPKFYVVVFVLLPVCFEALVFWQIILKENKNMLFAESVLEAEVESDMQPLFIITQASLWLAVYFWTVMPLTSFVGCFEWVISTFSWDSLYDRFPLASHRRLHCHLGMCGSFWFLVGAILLISCFLVSEMKAESTEMTALTVNNTSSTVFINIMTAAVLQGPLLLIKYGVEGVFIFLNLLLLDFFPGVRMFLWASHIGVGALIFWHIFSVNMVAGTMLLISWTLFFALPFLSWLLCFTRCILKKMPKRDFLRERSVSTLANYSEYNLYSPESKLYHKMSSLAEPMPGQRLYILAAWKRAYVFVASTTRTENESYILITRNYVYRDPSSFLLNFLGDCDQTGNLYCFFMIALVVPFILNVMYFYLADKMERHWYDGNDKRERIMTWMSPPMGQSWYKLIHNAAAFDHICLVVDSPGFDSSFALLSQLKIHQPLKIYSVIWKANGVADLCKLKKQIKALVASNLPSDLNFKLRTKIDIGPLAILQAQSMVSFRMSLFSYGGDWPKTLHHEDFPRGLVDESNLMKHISMGHDPLETSDPRLTSVALVTIGTSDLCYGVKSRATIGFPNVKNITSFSYIVERSIFIANPQTLEVLPSR